MGNNWMELELTKDEEEFVRRGAELYKITYLDTIDNIFVIARSINILHDRYHGSGIKGGFTDALVQYGFTARDGGAMNKAIRSHLSQLLAHEAEVRAWWEKVPERVKRDWLSAKAIHRHWTNSKKPADAPRQEAKAKSSPSHNVHVAKEEPVADVTRWQAEIDALKSENIMLRTELETRQYVFSAREGLLTLKQYRTVLKCLASDRANAVSAAELDEATRIFRNRKYAFVSEAEMPTPKFRHVTLEEQKWLAFRKRQAARAKVEAKNAKRRPGARPKPPKSLPL